MKHRKPHKDRFKEIRTDPGRGGCGILALAELSGEPSHNLVLEALRGLSSMEHRGGTLENTGDGAGLLLKHDRKFFERFIKPGRALSSPKEPLIVGTVFFLHGERNIPQLKREIELVLRRGGLKPLGWREVPTDESVLGAQAREDVPTIYQILVAKGHRRESQLTEALHEAKVVIEGKLAGLVNVVSLAPFTTVYKALATADQLRNFYTDLADPSFTASVVVGHRRFSTNTFSNWNLVQPFRFIAHNGEINTIKSNCRAIRDADCALKMGNTLMSHGSDSAQVDRVAEMMAANGMDGIHEALRRMMPPAWMENADDDRERDFFVANRRALGTLGAWEGPIAIVGTDGRTLAAVLDRMGLRPLRYVKTRTGRLIVSSEIGAVDVDPAEIEMDGQLEPGGMIVADLETGEFVPQEKANRWIVDRTRMDFGTLSTVDLMPIGTGARSEPLSVQALNAFGWTKERVRHVTEMIKCEKEPVYGMGNDRPLAIFSENHSRLYSFLHQIVAVVTNPPIDPLREGGAIDTTIYLGRSPRLTRKSDYKSWPQYELEHPILTNEDMEALLDSKAAHLKAHVLDATFEDEGKARTIVRRIHDITNEALDVIKSGSASMLIVSDYEATKGTRLPLPMLLVISSIHQSLADHGLRRDASIVAETAEAHEAHDCAILLAYGATAINPYAMFDLAKKIPDMTSEQANEKLVQSIVHTLKRVMSKMGITTIAGYRGSALFEAIGISSDIVEYYIPDTASRLGGITIEDIYDDTVARFTSTDDKVARNQNTSVYRKEVTDALQLVARDGNTNGDYDRFVKLLEETPPVYLRDMLEFKDCHPSLRSGSFVCHPSLRSGSFVCHPSLRSGSFACHPSLRSGSFVCHPERSEGSRLNAVKPRFFAKSNINMAQNDTCEVISANEIVRTTFSAAAMSHGALNAAAHRAIAAGFNHFGAKSNSGEGGEDIRRDPGNEWGTDRSRIRQIASGRFGVDARYLINADEIEIKIGQGAKPGEGGHLPGHKVTAEIALIRKTKSGVDLISPPPHHDIYSIEDLAQLAKNLRELNPRAFVSVKVPSITGLGTIAVGIAKAGADIIVISGFTGGTGAASSSSIAHAGLPLERGISEVHQYLVANGIREHVRIRADGGIKSGTDIAKIMALGADEVSFGTPLLIAECCIFCRGCNKGNCPVGIATHDEKIQGERFMRRFGSDMSEASVDVQRYEEAKNGIIRYLTCAAEHLRSILSELGLRHPRELVGRVDLLDQRSSGSERWNKLELAELVQDVSRDARIANKVAPPLRNTVSEKNAAILNAAKPVLEGQADRADIHLELTNQDHAVGATLSGAIAKRGGLHDKRSISITAEGYAGQGFAFGATSGMHFRLNGYANDAACEIMSGDAKVVIAPPPTADRSSPSHLVGNAAAYGATGGTLFVAGTAGQRFGVRNSGATLICEGAGKYAFEYMTGGTGIVLGKTGPCVGSGMTGGELFLYDPNGKMRFRLHADACATSLNHENEQRLKETLGDFFEETKSPRAAAILENWNECKSNFIFVTPSS